MFACTALLTVSRFWQAVEAAKPLGKTVSSSSGEEEESSEEEGEEQVTHQLELLGLPS